MRPNYAQDEPPAGITVGGVLYPCATDYRVWLDVLKMLGDLRTDDPEKAAEQLAQIEETVFGGILTDEDPAETIRAVAEFSKGYPSAPVQSTGGEERTYSFEYDLNEIVVAIRNQHGVDLSYRRTEPFHWWEFLLLFRTLAGDHRILNIMEIRGYKGKDPELRKLKRAYALPEELTEKEKEEYEAFDALFEPQEAEYE